MRWQPDAVLISGDLADNSEYDQVQELLAPLQAPLYVVTGNHDDRRALHHHFGVPGGAGEPVDYSVDLGAMRLVVLDTTRPGEDPGSLDSAQLAWLDAELSAARDIPTLIAMHHPPIPIAIPAWDELSLDANDRAKLAEVVGRHPQVRRLVAGHVHRAIIGELAGRAVVTVPSTYVQAQLRFTDEIELAPEPPMFAVHAVANGDIVSHLQPIHQGSHAGGGPDA
jgi:3',5'-cyclic AMP phosphodiesterase CpdA